MSDKKATKRQTDLILKLIPDFSKTVLKKLTVAGASDVIDVRLGKKVCEQKCTPRKTNFTSTQAKACKKHGVSDEVRVTLLRDRLTTGVRTRGYCATQPENESPSE